MIFWNSAQTKEELKKGDQGLIRKLAIEVFKKELVYPWTQEICDRHCHPMTLYSAALNDNRSKCLGYFEVTIVTERYYQKLLKGTAKEEDFEPWSYETKESPLLFIRNLVIKDRRATPYIFRTLVKELQETCAHSDIYLHRAFTIATHWITKRVLKNYQFEQTGTYQGKYPILMASRDKSTVFNSFMKRYENEEL